MAIEDIEYYIRRLNEALSARDEATTADAAQAHEEMAAQYEKMLTALGYDRTDQAQNGPSV